MTYIDIHTHHYQPESNVLAIENIHEAFNQIDSERPVSAGLHPWWLAHAEQEILLLDKLCHQSNVWAVGECGLDKLAETSWDLQIRFFRKQIAIAERANKPLIIHCVRAFSEVSGMLKNTNVPVIFHGVNKKFATIEPLLASGYYLSFGKALTGDEGTIRETFRQVPLNRVFLETDDSGLSIKEIFKIASKIRNVPENEIALQIQKNFHTVFKHATI